MAEKGLVNRNMASLGIFIGILGKLEILKKTVCEKQGRFSLPCSLSLEYKSPCTKKFKHLNTSLRKLFLKNYINYCMIFFLHKVMFTNFGVKFKGSHFEFLSKMLLWGNSVQIDLNFPAKSLCIYLNEFFSTLFLLFYGNSLN